MITQLAPAPLDTDPSDGNGEGHLYCCNPNTAICGIDLDGADDDPDMDVPTCVVCADLQTQNVPCSPTCHYPNG